ncbi:MAG: DUF2783 domain-containing protein [Alphaproteobacteria bacterium]|nr:DUF2783 domain-containing protein [Alphaproteobacteria bacterium]
MSDLIRASRIDDPDRWYEMLIEAHEGLSDEDGRRLNARLVLILANQVGDIAVLEDSLALARRTL